MAELRTDPITGVRALIGAAADEGPGAALGGALRGAQGAPLLTPAESAFVADASAPAPEANRDLFLAVPASGGHERIAAPVDVERLADLDTEAAVGFVETWRERMRSVEGAATLHLCLDDRPGTRLAADLFALASVPAALARERERFSAYAMRTMGGNLLADLVQEEVRRRERVVAIDSESILVAPWASRVPYQLTVLPRRPRARFELDGPSGAAMLHTAASRLTAHFGAGVPLCCWVRTAPQGAEHYSWRIDVLPRVAAAGAFELGTGIPFNPVTPERAAAELRDAGASSRDAGAA